MKQLVLIMLSAVLCVCLLAQNAPENLTLTHNGAQIELTWDAVTGASQYNIYRSSNPYATTWGEPVAQVSALFHSEPANADRFFFRVTSQSSSAPGGFVLVPGGTFTMGRTIGTGNSNELPTHSVTLSPFYIGRYEVTQAEYTAVMGTNPAAGYSAGVGDNYPVYAVSWYALLKYCNLRSMAEGLTPVYAINVSTDPATWGSVPTGNNTTWNMATCNWNANGYRLPTESEWEYAARGATNTPDYLYSGSNDIGSVAWYNLNSGGTTHIVGGKTPNSLGLYDMSGNVWEWCWDRWGSYTADPQTNPPGQTTGTNNRVNRGGSWYYTDVYSRVAQRNNYAPATFYLDVGFRLCRSAL